MSKVIKNLALNYIPFNLPKFSGEHTGEVPESNKKTTPQEEAKEIYQKAYTIGLEEGKKAGFKAGYDEGLKEGKGKGYQEGKDQADKELEALKARLSEEMRKEREAVHNFLLKLDAQTRDFILNLDKEVIKIALALSEKIIFAKPSVDEKSLLNLVRRCLEYVAEGIKVVVRIHPEDLELLKGNLDQLPPTYHLVFQEDPSISRGGILLNSSMGVVDATLETRIRKVFSELENED